MMIKNLLICGTIAMLALGSCRKNAPITPDPGSIPVIVLPPVPYTITEDFESGVKTGYDSASVATGTGLWFMDGALLGTDASDTKNGKKSVRIQGTTGNLKRNGVIAMNYDIRHLSSISIKSALTNFADKARPAKNVTPPYLKGTWELQESKDGGKTYAKIGATITCDTVLTATNFAITDTIPVRFRIVNTSDLNGTSKVRINIDDIVFSGLGTPGITIGTPDTGGADTVATTKPTAARGVTIGTDAPPATGDNSDLLFGNPSSAQASLVMPDNYLIDMGYYTESYSNSRRTPNWVSWHLDGTNTTSATGRLDNFAGFSGLPVGFYVVQSNSYSGSGFDRGHNCPSADRTSSANANSATFLMTNMIPQAPKNNQQTWANLESYLRLQVVQGNEVYVIMGSYGTGGIGSASSTAVQTINAVDKVVVPSNVWKVAIIVSAGDADLLRVSATTRIIAVNTPNINTIDADWTKYEVTIRSIEQATGYNLLSALPQSLQDAIETKVGTGL